MVGRSLLLSNLESPEYSYELLTDGISLSPDYRKIQVFNVVLLINGFYKNFFAFKVSVYHQYYELFCTCVILDVCF